MSTHFECPFRHVNCQMGLLRGVWSRIMTDGDGFSLRKGIELREACRIMVYWIEGRVIKEVVGG